MLIKIRLYNSILALKYLCFLVGELGGPSPAPALGQGCGKGRSRAGDYL